MNEHTTPDPDDEEPEVVGFTNALQLLARVSHEQAQSANDAVLDAATQQRRNLAAPAPSFLSGFPVPGVDYGRVTS